MAEFKLGPIAKIVPGKGQHYDLCIIDFNLDIESGTCAVTVNKEGIADKKTACSYCYSQYLFKSGEAAYRPKQIKEAEFKKIAERYSSATTGKGLVLRLGKNVEFNIFSF